jgi:hypothetical protein
MPVFAIRRLQDSTPFALLEAPDAAAAIEAIEDLDALGDLLSAGYWGSEDEHGYTAGPATRQQIASWNANALRAYPGLGPRGAQRIEQSELASFVLYMAEPDF